MKERNRVTIISLAMVSIIVLALFIVLSYGSYTSNDDIVDVAPEKEHLSLSEKIAKNWSEQSHLVNVAVSIQKSPQNEPYVIYTYTNTTVGDIPVYCLEISVYDAERYDTREYMWHSPNGEDKPIGNWSIDSKEAYEIAINNDKIKAFMGRYPNAEIDGGLMLSNASGTPTWYIKMVDWGFLDNPHTAEIQIDATTGNVLYVNADLTGSSISAQDVCIGFSIVFIAVIAVLVFKKRGKSRKENPDKEERAYQREEK